MTDLDKKLIDTIKRFNNYPDINELILKGQLKKKGARYEVIDMAVLDVISPWVTEMAQQTKKSLILVKLTKPGKSHQKLYERLKKMYPQEFKD